MKDFKNPLDTEVGITLKVLVLSILLSVVIKFAGPALSIPPTTPVALAMVLLPALLLGLALAWRGWQQRL